MTERPILEDTSSRHNTGSQGGMEGALEVAEAMSQARSQEMAKGWQGVGTQAEDWWMGTEESRVVRT